LSCRTSGPVHSCSPATAPMHTNTNVLPRAIANVQPAACAHPCAAAHVYDRAHVLHPRTSTHTPHARKKLHRTHTSALGSNFIPLAPFTVHLTGPIHTSRSWGALLTPSTARSLIFGTAEAVAACRSDTWHQSAELNQLVCCWVLFTSCDSSSHSLVPLPSAFTGSTSLHFRFFKFASSNFTSSSLLHFFTSSRLQLA
jgi:hypothetical protein